jgi:peptidoglycan/xylan/chitin deacetylase (PgdA/CDA1 family)
VTQSPLAFTTSWDDGHPLDLRVADLLARYGCRATFYVPLANGEGLPVMSAADIRRLGEGFEIGSHTIDHCYLDTVGVAEARRQIAEGKSGLEDILGRRVDGFCYPGGHFTRDHRQMVIDEGFQYARTIAGFHRRPLLDPFRMPTTLQFFPNDRPALLRNFLRHGHWGGRSGLFAVALRGDDLMARLRAMLDHLCRAGGLFHLWGHSWELDRFNGWALLDDFLSYVAKRVPPEGRLTNGEALRGVRSTAATPTATFGDVRL